MDQAIGHPIDWDSLVKGANDDSEAANETFAYDFGFGDVPSSVEPPDDQAPTISGSGHAPQSFGTASGHHWPTPSAPYFPELNHQTSISFEPASAPQPLHSWDRLQIDRFDSSSHRYPAYDPYDTSVVAQSDASVSSHLFSHGSVRQDGLHWSFDSAAHAPSADPFRLIVPPDAGPSDHDTYRLTRMSGGGAGQTPRGHHQEGEHIQKANVAMHSPERPIGSQPSNEPSGSTHQCPYPDCVYESKNKKDVLRHVCKKDHLHVELPCSICHEPIVANVQNVKRHFKSKHPSAKKECSSRVLALRRDLRDLILARVTVLDAISVQIPPAVVAYLESYRWS